MKSLNQILEIVNSESYKKSPNNEIEVELKKLEQDKIIYFIEPYKTWSIILGKGNLANADIPSFNLKL